jgi:hypothetical protein
LEPSIPIIDFIPVKIRPQNPYNFSKKRYWVDATFFNKTNDSPVFLYIGGESELSASSLLEGFCAEITQKAQALRVGLEHRFYGKSIPTK